MLKTQSLQQHLYKQFQETHTPNNYEPPYSSNYIIYFLFIKNTIHLKD